MTASRSRSVLSLLAAYIIVLQALLLPMTVATSAAFDGSLCATAAAHPAGDQPGCPCSAGCGMQCCAQALAAPPQIPVSVIELAGGESLALPQSLAAAYFAHERPQTARAPPAA